MSIKIKLKNPQAIVPTSGKIQLKPTITIKNDSKDSKSVNDIYSKLEHEQSILLRPSQHVGSTFMETFNMFILNADSSAIEKQNVSFVKGIYKLYDECLVNARDQYIRMIDSISDQEKIRAGTLKPNKKIYLDHEYRVPKNIWINVTADEISIKNDGDGVDIAMHECGMYVPHMIFGSLLTSRNYDDNEKRRVGGQFGYGSKLCNILSTEFRIETIDSYRKLKYTQTFTDNMSKHTVPVITKCNIAPYTIISFKPDFKRFGITSLSDGDHIRIMKKRAYDIAGTSNGGLTVHFNGEKIPIKTFERYVDLYIGTRGECKRVYKVVNEDWEIAVAASPEGSFEHVSFVNGICTYQGGKHVEHVGTVLSKRLKTYSEEKKKGMKILTEKLIKDNMFIFINCTLENPQFGSQTKETLETPTSSYRKKCSFINEDEENSFIEKLADTKVSILKNALDGLSKKQIKEMTTQTKSRRGRVDVEKLTDAKFAKSTIASERNKCVLILAEGDSAKSTVKGCISGLPPNERDYYGTLALRGKIKNTNDASATDITGSETIMNIIIATGVQHGLDYSIKENYDKLRYGKVWIMTDADVDGSHIKGLIMNFFTSFCPSLIEISYLASPLTPILKIFKDDAHKIHLKDFFDELEYKEWLVDNPEVKHHLKYYKGLGTSNAEESREYFRNLKLQTYECDEHYGDSIRKAFAKSSAKYKASDKRKDWILEYIHGSTSADASASGLVTPLYDNIDDELADIQSNVDSILSDIETRLGTPQELADLDSDGKVKKIKLKLISADQRSALTSPAGYKKYTATTANDYIDNNKYLKRIMYITEFINTKLVEFSKYSTERAVPCIMDGFKPGQRKIMQAALNKPLVKEMKVSQFAGYVAETMAYHHGEINLHDTIVNLAQNYVGSNNLNLLVPEGAFGTRLENGSDHAATRYIHTYLAPYTRDLFNKDDEKVYIYNSDDGTITEPLYLAPILPIILINGCLGIGTGWSSTIPCYNIIDIIDNIKRYLNGEQIVEMFPFYRGFNGTIELVEGTKSSKKGKSYIVRGKYERTSDTTIVVSELPVGSNRCKSFEAYNTFLETQLDGYEPKKTRTVVGKTKKAESKKKTKASTESDILDFEYSSDPVKSIYHITFKSADILDKALEDTDAFEKKYHLSETITISNMHLFDMSGHIKKYDTPEQIMTDYCDARIKIYAERKKANLEDLNVDIIMWENKIRFIKCLNDPEHEIKTKGKTKKDLEVLLEKYEFYKNTHKRTKRLLNNVLDLKNKITSGEIEKDIQEIVDEEQTDGNYNYLLKQQFYKLLTDGIKKLEDELQTKRDAYALLMSTSENEMWLCELDKIDNIKCTIDMYLSEGEDNSGKTVKGGKKYTRKKAVTQKPMKIKMTIRQPQSA